MSTLLANVVVDTAVSRAGTTNIKGGQLDYQQVWHPEISSALSSRLSVQKVPPEPGHRGEHAVGEGCSTLTVQSVAARLSCHASCRTWRTGRQPPVKDLCAPTTVLVPGGSATSPSRSSSSTLSSTVAPQGSYASDCFATKSAWLSSWMFASFLGQVLGQES